MSSEPPPSVAAEVAMAAAMHAEMDVLAAQRDAAAKEQGRQVACALGCAHCCETLITTTEAEAILVAEFLVDPANRDAHAHFEARYPRWREEIGDLADAATEGGRSGDRDAVVDAMREAARRKVPCAFLRDGACSIYAVRPIVCRRAHALDSADECAKPVDERRPQTLDFVPLEDFIARLIPKQIASQRVLRGGAGTEPLCDAVHRMLREPEARSATPADVTAEVGEGRIDELFQVFNRIIAGEEAVPLSINPAEAATIASVLHAEIDRGTAARDAAAAKMGRTIACAEGCAACCNTVVVSTEAEVLAVARYLLAPEHEAAREAFVARYPTWRATLGDSLDRVRTRAHAGDAEGVNEALREATRLVVPCAFLSEAGACTVYEARPNACRVMHALDSNVQCNLPVDARQTEVIHFVPIANFMGVAAKVNRAMHAVLRGYGIGSEPLCDGVHRVLSGDQDLAK